MTMGSQGISHSDTFTASPNQTSRLQKLILLSRCSRRYSRSLMHAGLHGSEDPTVCHQVPLKAYNVDMVSLLIYSIYV